MLLNKIQFVTSHHHLGIYNLQALALIFKRVALATSIVFFFFEKLSRFRNEGV